jgi:hypothetical protein
VPTAGQASTRLTAARSIAPRVFAPVHMPPVVPPLPPESILREECLAVLDIAEPGMLSGGAGPLDHETALAETAAWVATRDPSERPVREPVGELTFGVG